MGTNADGATSDGSDEWLQMALSDRGLSAVPDAVSRSRS